MANIGGSHGRRIQVRSIRKNGWTKARRTKFLSVLAATCNTTLAAQSVGKSHHSAHGLRKRDGEFSQLWHEALDAGYERLENELLARALGHVSSGDNPDPDDIVPTVPADWTFDPELAIRVLQLRRNLGRQEHSKGKKPRMTQGEIDAALCARIDALAARRGSE